MEREECEKKILELMKQIKEVANEYYGGTTNLTMAILKSGTIFAYNRDSYTNDDKPINLFFREGR